MTQLPASGSFTLLPPKVQSDNTVLALSKIGRYTLIFLKKNPDRAKPLLKRIVYLD